MKIQQKNVNHVGKLFEAEENASAYCSDECKNKSKNVNSASSYQKMHNLHDSLKLLFNTLDESQFSKIDEIELEQIKQIANFSISDFKKYTDPNKMKNLQKYIKILQDIS